ncbi:MAG: hypothetical protein PHE54_04335 [Bacilli bacterium]|nr:hypothetical protein [Bacilli bacterium]
MSQEKDEDIEIIDEIPDDEVITEEKLMETLNLAEILDPDLVVPKEEKKVMVEAKEKNSDKKALIFIITIFVILIGFIVLLPFITEFF